MSRSSRRIGITTAIVAEGEEFWLNDIRRLGNLTPLSVTVLPTTNGKRFRGFGQSSTMVDSSLVGDERVFSAC